MSKLSLDAFKAMAENVQTKEVMNQIDGGLYDLTDCHGFWGWIGKHIIVNSDGDGGSVGVGIGVDFGGN